MARMPAERSLDGVAGFVPVPAEGFFLGAVVSDSAVDVTARAGPYRTSSEVEAAQGTVAPTVARRRRW
jgi:hypothetical protein